MFYIEVSGETLAYQVDQIKVVLPTELGDLKAVAGEDYVTLVTCTPYAVNTHRLLVRGHAIPYEEAAEIASPDDISSPFTLEPWMWWLIGGAGLGAVALLNMVVVVKRKRRGADDGAGERNLDTQ